MPATPARSRSWRRRPGRRSVRRSRSRSIGCGVATSVSRVSWRSTGWRWRSREKRGALGAAAGRERRDEAAAAVTGECFDAIEPMLGTRAACTAVGRSRATHYRRLAPPKPHPSSPRPSPPNKLTDDEATEILAVLRSPRFVDLSPAQVFFVLLDEGIYLASVSSFYRLLRVHGEVRERRRQATHPARVRPELVARRPLVVWSWDITKLKGPRQRRLLRPLRRVGHLQPLRVAWCTRRASRVSSPRNSSPTAVARHRVPPGQLRIHADRGSSMTSNPVVELLVFLGIGRSHSRPHVSNDNPFSESQFKTLKYCPTFPERFGCIEDDHRVLRDVLHLLQP